MAAQLLFSLGSYGDTTVGCTDLGLVEEHLDLMYFVFIVSAISQLIGGIVVTTDDLITAGIAAHLIVGDAEAHHIDSHIRGRLIRILTIDTLKQGIQHGENLDVAVIVDSYLVVSLQMERVNHIDVVQVGSSGLVGNVYRMLQRQTPYGESFELGVTGTDTSLILIIEL